MKQIEKNRQELLEEIEKLSNRPINDSIAEELSVYKSALDALDMICGDDKKQEEILQKDTRFFARESGYSTSVGETVHPLTRQAAEQWVSNMENVDGSTGGQWTMEQTEQVRKQRGFDLDPVQFWATMNMMYSDYFVVAKKNGTNTVDFYADMSRAFLDDKDAKPHKLARYVEYIAGSGDTSPFYSTRLSGGSEFMDVVSGKDQTAAWSVVDGHMRRMKEVNPRVYNIIIEKMKQI